jgi:hypothetical protein
MAPIESQSCEFDVGPCRFSLDWMIVALLGSVMEKQRDEIGSSDEMFKAP